MGIKTTGPMQLTLPLPVIIPTEPGVTWKQHTLAGLDWLDIVETLGFHENLKDDEFKVRYSWGFQVGDRVGAIWDYKGSYLDKIWSAWGPRELFIELFGAEHVV
jgi:hypothetical protein